MLIHILYCSSIFLGETYRDISTQTACRADQLISGATIFFLFPYDCPTIAIKMLNHVVHRPSKTSCLMSQTCLKNGIGMVFTNGHAVWCSSLGKDRLSVDRSIWIQTITRQEKDMMIEELLAWERLRDNSEIPKELKYTLWIKCLNSKIWLNV